MLYDGDELLAEYSVPATGSPVLLRRYVHGAGSDDPLIWYEGAGIASTALRRLRSNHQGSIVAVTDNAGTAIAINAYDEWGIPASANVGRFQYTGQAWLPELGLYYYKARIYSPTLGRFMQTDPIGYEDQVNLYAYVGNDPGNKVDPDGLDEITLFRPLAGAPAIADHEAHMVGNDKVGWTYQSKDGGASSGTTIGSSQSSGSATTTKSFKTAAQGLEFAKKEGYKDGYRFSSNAKQDAANIRAAGSELKKDYGFCTSNCGQAVNAGETAAGIPHKDAINPRTNNTYMGSADGKKDGWTRVLGKDYTNPRPKPPTPYESCVLRGGCK